VSGPPELGRPTSSYPAQVIATSEAYETNPASLAGIEPARKNAAKLNSRAEHPRKAWPRVGKRESLARVSS
jgi:hypothetical protein